MKEPNFPDKAPPGSSKTPTTIENVAHLLDCAGINVRYNLIKKKDEIVIPGHLGTDDNMDNVTLAQIVSMASRYGLPHGLVPDFVQALADRNAYNPVADWIRSREWDGTRRLSALCDTVVEHPDYPGTLKCTLLYKWLLSATAAALMPAGYKGRGVLTLQGRQGLGKTSWVKSLVTDDKLRDEVIKVDHHFDGSKDSVLGAITHWLVEIGEVESSFRKDIDRLKGFLTSDSDRVRRPYGRRESEYQRRTVFAATVNGEKFLADSTGNSRWWTIPVVKLDYQHSIDMQQLFAEMASAFEGGAKWWLTDEEEAQLEAWNQRHRAVSAVADRLIDFIEVDGIGRERLRAYTATEVLDIIGYERPTNMQAKECAAALRDLLGEPKRINGSYKWRVPFKDTPADYLKLVHQRQDAEENF